MASTPAFAAEEWTWPQEPFQWRLALMLMITPLFWAFMHPLKTDWLILKVPTVSMSRTLLTPLVEIFSAVARKFPAAPFTRTSILPNLATTLATTYLQESILETSPGSEKHDPYWDNSWQTASFFSLLRDMSTTALAPCLRYYLAISLSMPPLDPPVMRQTFPSYRF